MEQCDCEWIGGVCGMVHLHLLFLLKVPPHEGIRYEEDNHYDGTVPFTPF